jgi:putative ABC transport system permease protein
MIGFLAIKNLLHKPLQAMLSWILLTASVAIISLLLLLQGQFQQKFEKNIRGIDLVMGAKGSPLQLILSSVYHLDNPTGNIAYEEAQKWMKNPMVESAIPLAYGDTYKGYAIVGTTPAYLEKYAAHLSQGQVFKQDFEVVVGTELEKKGLLSLGQEFYGTHGANAEGEEHHEHAYRVVGVIAPTGTILDHLVISNLESVWNIHVHEAAEDSHTHHFDEPEAHESHEHDEAASDPKESDREITAVLFKFRSPMAIVQWPRLVAQQSDVQLASPVVEINRLFSLFGIGIDTLTIIGWGIMGLAALSVFVTLFSTLKERRYELALMRTLGGRRSHVFWLLLLESLLLCMAGFISGILMSRLSLWLLAQSVEQNYQISIDQFGFQWLSEGRLLLLTLGIGLLAAMLPAQHAYRLDISKTLTNE